MIRKLENSAVRKVRSFSLPRKQKSNSMREMTLPARKELKADVYEARKADKRVSASKCSASEYEYVDYCSPLFP